MVDKDDKDFAREITWSSEEGLQKEYYLAIIAQNQAFHNEKLQQRVDYNERLLKQNKELEVKRHRQYDTWQQRNIIYTRVLVMGNIALVIAMILIQLFGK